jgi:hypothetical protein
MRFKVPEGLKYFANRKQLHSTFKVRRIQKTKVYVGPKDFADLSP